MLQKDFERLLVALLGKANSKDTDEDGSPRWFYKSIARLDIESLTVTFREADDTATFRAYIKTDQGLWTQPVHFCVELFADPCFRSFVCRQLSQVRADVRERFASALANG